MDENDILENLICLVPIALIVVGTGVIVAVGALARTPKPDAGAPHGTGARGTTIAVVGHVLGVVTLLFALAGLIPALGMSQEQEPIKRVVGAMFALLVLSGLALGPALFAIGIVIARGGREKSRLAVLLVATWVLAHHVLAAISVSAMDAPDVDYGLVAFGAVVGVVGLVHAGAMAWVGLARIGPGT